ncbi:MAG: alcohol dehydrogenase catalytic domain-containing protein [Lachnospiraceae bacterium]|jgi:threonine dehydrogenase-like Zn-dependent dehydrogenase|nr:alcohol dehydrogenase catalytic domain-containing protein [Lachnospiraceae bacterium]
MKGVYFDGSKAVFREDLPVPEPSQGHSRIRVMYANICSTDKEVLKGYRPQFRGVMGHEFAGVVDRTENPELMGRVVVGELNEGCGHCLYCRSGREKHCPDRKVLGLDGLDGCFAEYLVLADHLIHPVPPDLPPEQAVYTEPLAAALEIPTQVHLDPRSSIAVIGDGRLAFMIAQVLHLSGAELTVIGKHREKLDAFSPFASHTRLCGEYDGTDAHDAESTYETVVEASGSPEGILLALKIVRRQGTIVLKSTYAGTAEVDMSLFVVNEITLVGSRCGPFEPAIRLLKDGLVRFPEVEWHTLDDFDAAFRSKAFKAGFRINVQPEGINFSQKSIKFT